MKTSVEDLDRFYEKRDPWGYQVNPADIERKRIILARLREIGEFDKALDIGCGEGWITKDLPANKIYGYEISQKACKRFPENILQWEPDLSYDLVITTGTLYENYDWVHIVSTINRQASKYILTCNIAERECLAAILRIRAEEIHLEEFEYDRGDERFMQRLRIFRK